MKRESLDIYDIKPAEMVAYLRYNGLHFNKHMCDYAVSFMEYSNLDEEFKPITKEKVDELLEKFNIKLKNNILYDYVYVANMIKADCYKSSVKDDNTYALLIKDMIDDKDGYDGLVFNRWYADMCRKGIPINWVEMI